MSSSKTNRADIGLLDQGLPGLFLLIRCAYSSRLAGALQGQVHDDVCVVVGLQGESY